MADFSIKTRIVTKNLSILDEVNARLKDFSIPLSNIVAQWAKGNKRKFAAAKGKENTGASGTDLDPAVWQPLMQSLGRMSQIEKRAYFEWGQKDMGTPYQRWKRKHGMPNWLMVATGSLLQSLSSRGMFGEFIDNARAVFGQPLDPEDSDKARYNYKKRPTIFLSLSDRLMVKAQFQNYLNLGGNYRDLLFARAGRLKALQEVSNG